MNLIELYDVSISSSGYKFGEGTNPILASRELYISVLIFCIMSLVAMIYFSYKRRWHIFFVSMLVALLLVFFIFQASVVIPAA